MTKEGCKVLSCNCEHADQDKIYGKGKRLHNVTKDGDAYCTVCTPRRLNCDKSGPVDPAPHFGLLVAIPGAKPKIPKKV